MLLLAIVIVIAAIILWFLFKPNSSGNLIPSTNPLGNSSGNGTGNSASRTENRSGPTANSPAAGSSTTTPTNGPPPITPYGDFVSNHHPGGDASTAEASTCNTSPRATCYIKFTKGTETKKLDVRIVDARGASIWYWDTKAAGLSSGSWTVTAVATLNGQTKTSSDPMALVVQ